MIDRSQMQSMAAQAIAQAAQAASASAAVKHDPMDTFNQQLASVLSKPPPVTKEKMNKIVKCALKAHAHAKKVTSSIEKFVVKCEHEYKVTGLYVMDAIMRNYRRKYPDDYKIMQERFSDSLKITMKAIWDGTKYDESQSKKVIKVVGIWKREQVFIDDKLDVCDKLIAASHAGIDIDFAPDVTEDVAKNLKLGNVKKLEDSLGGENYKLLQALAAEKLGISLSQIQGNQAPKQPERTVDVVGEVPEMDYVASPEAHAGSPPGSVPAGNTVGMPPPNFAQRPRNMSGPGGMPEPNFGGNEPPRTPSPGHEHEDGYAKGYDDRHARHYEGVDAESKRNDRKREFEAPFREEGQKRHRHNLDQQDIVAKVAAAPSVPLNADDYLAQFTTALEMEEEEPLDEEGVLIDSHKSKKKKKKDRSHEEPYSDEEDSRSRRKKKKKHRRGSGDGRERSMSLEPEDEYGAPKRTIIRYEPEPPAAEKKGKKSKWVKLAAVKNAEISKKTRKFIDVPTDSLLIYASTVWVGGLPKNKYTNVEMEDKLKEIFADRGKITHVEHVAARGTAYLTFKNYKDAVDAVAWFSMEGPPYIRGKKLKLALALGAGFQEFFGPDAETLKRNYFNEHTGECFIPYANLPPKKKEGDMACLRDGNFIDLGADLNVPYEVLFRFAEAKPLPPDPSTLPHHSLPPHLNLPHQSQYFGQVAAPQLIRPSYNKSIPIGMPAQLVMAPHMLARPQLAPPSLARPRGPAPSEVLSDQQAMNVAAALKQLPAAHADAWTRPQMGAYPGQHKPMMVRVPLPGGLRPPGPVAAAGLAANFNILPRPGAPIPGAMPAQGSVPLPQSKPKTGTEKKSRWDSGNDYCPEDVLKNIAAEPEAELLKVAKAAVESTEKVREKSRERADKSDERRRGDRDGRDRHRDDRESGDRHRDYGRYGQRDHRDRDGRRDEHRSDDRRHSNDKYDPWEQDNFRIGNQNDGRSRYQDQRAKEAQWRSQRDQAVKHDHADRKEAHKKLEQAWGRSEQDIAPPQPKPTDAPAGKGWDKLPEEPSETEKPAQKIDPKRSEKKGWDSAMPLPHQAKDGWNKISSEKQDGWKSPVKSGGDGWNRGARGPSSDVKSAPDGWARTGSSNTASPKAGSGGWNSLPGGDSKPERESTAGTTSTGGFQPLPDSDEEGSSRREKSSDGKSKENSGKESLPPPRMPPKAALPPPSFMSKPPPADDQDELKKLMMEAMKTVQHEETQARSREPSGGNTGFGAPPPGMSLAKTNTPTTSDKQPPKRAATPPTAAAIDSFLQLAAEQTKQLIDPKPSPKISSPSPFGGPPGSIGATAAAPSGFGAPPMGMTAPGSSGGVDDDLLKLMQEAKALEDGPTTAKPPPAPKPQPPALANPWASTAAATSPKPAPLKGRADDWGVPEKPKSPMPAVPPVPASGGDDDLMKLMQEAMATVQKEEKSTGFGGPPKGLFGAPAAKVPAKEPEKTVEKAVLETPKPEPEKEVESKEDQISAWETCLEADDSPDDDMPVDPETKTTNFFNDDNLDD